MKDPILYQVPAWLLSLFIFVLMMIINWSGFRLRKKQGIKAPAAESDVLTSIVGAMLGLMALLLAFSFGMAATKFDERRKIIIEEANEIGTAILRTELYSDSIRKAFLKEFSAYVDARIAYYDASTNDEKIRLALQETENISGRIWKLAISSHERSDPAKSLNMIPALNSMIDIVSTRESSRQFMVPPPIWYILLLLTMVSAFLTGYNYKSERRNMIMITCFALMTTLTLYLVMDLNRPRMGLISLDEAQAKIVELKKLTVEAKR